jgi:mitochondrial fission protein ELM1
MSNNCWVVYDQGKVGTLNQCLGLAEALGLVPEIKPVAARFPWSYLPPSWWPLPLQGLKPDTQVVPPWPDLIIAGGRVSAAPVAAIRRITQGRTKVIQLLNPKMDPQNFDAVIAPFHDQLRGSNVLQTLGPFHRVTADRIAQEVVKFQDKLAFLSRPIAAVLIGGPNKYYRLDQKVMADMAVHLRRFVLEEGYSLVVTASRRTDKGCRTLLQAQLQGLPVHFWDGEGDNPYFAYLGVADVILVTSDSVSMTAEAASTGKPLYLYPLPGYSSKFTRFHTEMEKGGHLRIFNGNLTPYDMQPLNDIKDISSRLKAFL